MGDFKKGDRVIVAAAIAWLTAGNLALAGHTVGCKLTCRSGENRLHRSLNSAIARVHADGHLPIWARDPRIVVGSTTIWLKGHRSP